MIEVNDDASWREASFGKHMLNILHVRMNFQASFTLWMLYGYTAHQSDVIPRVADLPIRW